MQTTIALEAAALPVLVDRAGFELALLNIAANGRDAMPDGGRFDIHAAEVDGRVRISLRDNGIGMTPEVVARMFEPFYTTKPRGAGTGLGLGEVRRVVVEAGGRIDVESAPGAGTTLHLELPLADPSQAAAVAIHRKERLSQRRGDRRETRFSSAPLRLCERFSSTETRRSSQKSGLKNRSGTGMCRRIKHEVLDAKRMARLCRDRFFVNRGRACPGPDPRMPGFAN